MRHGEQGPGVRATLERMARDASAKRRERSILYRGVFIGVYTGALGTAAIVFILSILWR